MPLDANGIWIYATTDAASPAHTLLNRLANSVTAVVTALKNRLTALETIAAPVTLTLTGAWLSFGAPFGDLKYAVDRKEVSLSGAVKSGTGTITSLPAAARPLTRKGFLVPANAGAAEVRIEPSGIVTLHSYYAGGTNAIVVLDGISFRTDS